MQIYVTFFNLLQLHIIMPSESCNTNAMQKYCSALFFVPPGSNHIIVIVLIKARSANEVVI
jgi:hypothetical protein